MKDYLNTSEIEPLEGMIGQQRAVDAINTALNINHWSYNIYVCGEQGLGKTTYIMNTLKDFSKGKNNHKDWCYVYNFKDKRVPMVIDLPSGKGSEFKEDIDNFIESLKNDLKEVFESEDFEVGKNQLLENIDIEKEELLKYIKDYAKEKGFKVKDSKLGVVFVPEDNEAESESEEFYQNKKDLEAVAIQVMYKVRDLEEEEKKVILELEEEVCKQIINPHLDKLNDKYKEYEKINNYMADMYEDILEHSYLFYIDDEEIKIEDEALNRYEVNLIVDNKENEDSPVVLDINPTMGNLFGRAEYDYQNGNIKTDFTKLIAGSIQKANGGYLILYAEDILKNYLAWEKLKRSIRTQEVKIDTQVSINPDPIPLNIRVILIGDRYLYNLLCSHDSSFNKYFKILADFDYEMDKNENSSYEIAKYIALQCRENNLKHFTSDAVNEVMKYSARICGDKYKVSTQFNKILDILIESDGVSRSKKNEYVTEVDVKKAIELKINRLNIIEEKIDESLDTGFTLIDTDGEKVGVINALSVLSTAEYSFGKPSRVTVTTSPGNKGVVNIERECKMSGKIHDKGVLILSGYLSEKFAQDIIPSLNAYICFEQNYGGIDGDSATGAETYAILSSLSELPIKQNIAVTGSMNQKGDIQVVGGITEKVEGFYNLCKKRGLDGSHGVIIPNKNDRNLVLSDKMQEDVDKGLFNIYKVDRVEEAVEILTDEKFENIEKLVKEKLKKYSEVGKND